MADLLKELKEHACTFHKDIKSLEKAFSNPLTFFGTDSRRAEANVILKNELECITNINMNVGELIQEMEDCISDNNDLLKQVDNASEELNNITKLLEGCGFTFSEEKEVSGYSEENQIANGNDENITENISEHSEDTEKQCVLSYLSGNGKCEEILESTEKYLLANNINLDDIVTPLFHRNSGKKS